jgi:uncharacterized protein YydD (DUF2326 family)
MQMNIQEFNEFCFTSPKAYSVQEKCKMIEEDLHEASSKKLAFKDEWPGYSITRNNRMRIVNEDIKSLNNYFSVDFPAIVTLGPTHYTISFKKN